MHILLLASAFNSLTPADLVAVGLGQGVVDVEEVELQRDDVIAWGRPSGEPGEETVAVQSHPGALRAAACGCEVVGQLVTNTSRT
ncbi:hypothetical protein ACIBCU_38070 [Streptomyces sp. NPDC051064]|uniref:hypothetical protein n=1 Tax=Streptomyces sp. NPDC051064 TaxID=3365641 RepID=UPI0037A354F1